MKKLLAIPLLVLTVVTSISAQGSPSVVGVWKMVERTRDGITRRETMQPNLWIFTAKYLAVVQVNGDAPRPELPPNATEQQKVSAWSPVSAEAGEYEVRGSVLWTTLIVSKEPTAMNPGRWWTLTFRFDGPNTLWLTDTENQDGPIKSPRIMKFTRVE